MVPTAKQNKQIKQEPLEIILWKAADKLRKNIDAAEYKHVVLGLIFLKYISDSFESHHGLLLAGEGGFEWADPEDRDEYIKHNIFFVPESARWAYLQNNAKQPTIGQMVDSAMEAIENENPQLKGVLPKVYAKQNLDPSRNALYKDSRPSPVSFFFRNMCHTSRPGNIS
ncbi:type I restriction-modification system subunit M N-terminal domain-containing protein [Candidatus Nitrosacidococcus sp. I8]|uniref:type I restriction-modification system subunit M N-terminal domain-containing protein n=1 Tax=Candidatus Nitrosacidococcus sp. I8 TaxID=2942908 RepID=UPI00222635D7|nr:type I restriction-modification system subunit M N-terminal domain-containing protein [Candidatus Nitrosacidococcus sp. I8]CAH9018760.1 hypothetical protein NURINAE_01117 [Candidatus Nitrosacidococcus sp. I8]